MRRSIALLGLTIALMLSSSMASALGSDSANLKAILILASNKDAPIDKKIAAYESKLKKLFKFKHYQQVGSGSTRLKLPGKGTIKLSNYLLDIDMAPAAQGKLRTKLKWLKSDKALINTTLMMAKGSPTLLGGPSQGDGNLIMILVAK